MAASTDTDGAELCGYVLVHRVAQSCFGTLWVALDKRSPGSEAPVLLRRLELPEGTSSGALDAIERAALDARTLVHENILAVRDVVRRGAEIGVVYEPMEAEPLRSLTSWAGLRSLAFPIEVTLRLGVDLLAGLDALHRAQPSATTLAIYGGLSPDSVLLSRQGETKLCDAFVASSAALLEGVGFNTAKLAYAAPEQVHPVVALTPKADLFAVGAMLWELSSTRKLLVGSRSTMERKLLEHDLPSLSTAVTRSDRGLSAELVELIDGALAGDPARRPASAREMADRLRQCGHPVAERAEVAEFVTKLSGQRFDRRTAALRSRSIAAPDTTLDWRIELPPGAGAGRGSRTSGAGAASSKTLLGTAIPFPRPNDIARRTDAAEPPPPRAPAQAPPSRAEVKPEPRPDAFAERAAPRAADSTPPSFTSLSIGVPAREAPAAPAPEPRAAAPEPQLPPRASLSVQPRVHLGRTMSGIGLPRHGVLAPSLPFANMTPPGRPAAKLPPQARGDAEAEDASGAAPSVDATPNVDDAPTASVTMPSRSEHGATMTLAIDASAEPAHLPVAAERALAATADAPHALSPEPRRAETPSEASLDALLAASPRRPSSHALARAASPSPAPGAQVRASQRTLAGIPAPARIGLPDPAWQAALAPRASTAPAPRVSAPPAPPASVPGVPSSIAPRLERSPNSTSGMAGPSAYPAPQRKFFLAMLAAVLGLIAVGALAHVFHEPPSEQAPGLAALEEVPSATAARPRTSAPLPPLDDPSAPTTQPKAPPIDSKATAPTSAAALTTSPPSPARASDASSATPPPRPDDFQVRKLDDNQLVELFSLEPRSDLQPCAERLGKRAARLDGTQAKRARTELAAARRSLQRGKKEAALSELCAATLAYPDNVDAQRALAKLALDLGDPSRAKAAAERGLQSAPKDTGLRELLGDASALLGDIPGSRRHWLEAAGGRGSEAQRRERLITRYRKAGERALTKADFAEARSQLRRAVILSQGAYVPSMGLTEALLRSERAAAALVWAKRGAKALPKNGRAQLLLGDAYAATGDAENARSAWRAALRGQPKSSLAAQRLSRGRR